MSPTDWHSLLNELAAIAVCVGMLLTFALSLALRDVGPHGRDARRWGAISASLFTLALGLIGKHMPQGWPGDTFEVLVSAGLFLGFPFGVFVWCLFRSGSDSTARAGSFDNRWRRP